MWVCVKGLLINFECYSHFRIKPILGQFAVYGCEHVNGELCLLVFETEKDAEEAIQELARKIAALKDVECKCHVS